MDTATTTEPTPGLTVHYPKAPEPARDYEAERRRGLDDTTRRQFADWFRRAMQRAGLTTGRLAELSGFHVRTLEEYANGLRVPGGRNVLWLGDIMGAHVPVRLREATEHLGSHRTQAVKAAQARFYGDGQPEASEPQSTPQDRHQRIVEAFRLAHDAIADIAAILDEGSELTVEAVVAWLERTTLTANERGQLTATLWGTTPDRP